MLFGVLALFSLLTASAERPGPALLPPVCHADLSPDQFLDHSVNGLVRVISRALEQNLLTPAELGRHYEAGTRGRNLKTFVSYITKRLGDDQTVKAVGRRPSPAELEFQSELARLRREALDYGAANAEAVPRLTKEWRITVRKLALGALGRNPEGQDGLGYAIRGEPQPPSLRLRTWYRGSRPE